MGLGTEKIKAYVEIAKNNESLVGAILVFFSSFFLLNAIPFYPPAISFVLALACGVVGYRTAPAGVITGFILALPSIVYQSATFAWFYVIILAVVMYQVFNSWKLICTLIIIVTAPFAGEFFGWISILGMALSSLYFGSRKSNLIALPSVMLILLFASLWHVDNSAYFPLKKDYAAAADINLHSKKVVDIFAVIPQAINSFGQLLSFQGISGIWTSFGYIGSNLGALLFSDSMFLQLIAWAIALYAMSYTSGRTHSQLMASACLLIVAPIYFLIGSIFPTPLKAEFYGGLVFAIVVIGIFDALGVIVTRESELDREEKMKAYGKFGMSDMSLAGSEKSLADVGGYDDVKAELKDAIMMPLQKQELSYAYGIKPPAGVLLFGPPGTGKTMMMRALAKELRFNFIEVKSGQIISAWPGESEKNVSEIFATARKNAPTVLFFDEIDSIAKKRDQADDMSVRILSTLLQEIDGGTKSKKPVIVIGATNRPNVIDEALIRPGRLDKIIYMHLPDKEARIQILKVSLRKLPTSKDIDFDVLAKKTERFSGADLKNVVNEAKTVTAKEAGSKGKVIPISMEHLLKVLSYLKPSTGFSQLDAYEQFKLDYERRAGKSDNKELEKGEDLIKWSDVVGLDQVKQALLEAIELPLLHEEEMKEFKVKPSKGILLFGPPGTGKTLIVKAAANELKASFQTISGAELANKGYGQATNVIKEIFNRARENAPGIIFIDEIETFAPSREMGGNTEVLGQFLTEMDGVKGQKGVVVIAATNKPQLLDPAILRPGRFDKIFYIPAPDEKGREELFRMYLSKFGKNIEVHKLASITEGFSGADIAEICQSAKMHTLRAKLSGKAIELDTQSLFDIIKTRRPSITKGLLLEYQRFLDEYGERK